MRNARTRNADGSSALALALLFVIYTCLTAASSALHAAPERRDAFGGTLCTNAVGPGKGGSPSRSPGDCCSIGCLASNSGAACQDRIPAVETVLRCEPVAFGILHPAPCRMRERALIHSRDPPGV
jgi:hypothetical protein